MLSPDIGCVLSSEPLPVQCGICLEPVMGQQPPSARKFGLLECEHAFCLRCIRSWRGTGDSDATTETVSAGPCLLSPCAVAAELHVALQLHLHVLFSLFSHGTLTQSCRVDGDSTA
jgi:Zinc finger, C3HC4 type (RING finger)